MTALTQKVPPGFTDVRDVVNWRLCIGCGACVYACPENKLEMIDIADQGLRPVLTNPGCDDCSKCLDVCPGIGVSHAGYEQDQQVISSLAEDWGPVLEVWEGYATESDVRFAGSSGGIATALAMYCLEKEEMAGVLHVGNDKDTPYKNATVFSTSKNDIIATSGSKYSPASPCENLHLIEEQDRDSAFVGKPCDVEGLRKAQSQRPELSSRVGVAIGIFCAGTPSTDGTTDLLKIHNIDSEDVAEVRFRGRGWPGNFSARMKGEDGWRELTDYKTAWGFLQQYRPYRCHLCPDSTSEFADISCGDPWYRNIEEGEKGRSLLLVRTQKGKEILQGAIETGYVNAKRANPGILELSQKELQRKRGAIWGRLLTMRIMRIPAPYFGGFAMFQGWLRLDARNKFSSIMGTVKRIIMRKYYRPK